jgi:hypothetical protein
MLCFADRFVITFVIIFYYIYLFIIFILAPFSYATRILLWIRYFFDTRHSSTCIDIDRIATCYFFCFSKFRTYWPHSFGVKCFPLSLLTSVLFFINFRSWWYGSPLLCYWQVHHPGRHPRPCFSNRQSEPFTSIFQSCSTGVIQVFKYCNLH